MNNDQHELAALPDTHYQHLCTTLPTWVLQASPGTRNALKKASIAAPYRDAQATALQQRALKAASVDHWTHRSRLEQMLGKLQNARDFAEPLLTNALKARFGVELDVKTTYLRLYIPKTIPWFAIKSGGAHTWTVSLLDAALHNFQASETEPDAYEPDSTFITQPSPTGQFGTLPHIKRRMTIQGFTKLCRELDIGGQYSVYLNANLGITNPLVNSLLRTNVRNAHTSALQSALHMARVRQDIESDACEAILGLLQGRQGMKLDGDRLFCHDLTMMSSALTGIVVFATDLERAPRAKRIVVYIPEHPVKQYPDTLAFITELSGRLRSPAYQQFFSRFIDHEERGHFFADLGRRLSHVTWHQHQPGESQPSWRETPINNPNLQFSLSTIQIELWTHLYQRQLNKILNDARTIAVSTATADCNARWALWDALSKMASTIIEVAAFVALPFVPFLGELTLAYMAYQLLDETFEGVVDWAEGLQTEALGHLIGVVESAVQLGTLAVGGAIAVAELKPLLSRDVLTFFDKLTPVKAADGKTRYWNPDLTPYEQSVDLPTATKADPLGLYPHQGKTLLPIEDKLYAVELNAQTGQFEMVHPNRADAYRPALRHNNHGAWQTALEQPLSWDRDTVMRRIGPAVESLSSAEREQVLRISGYHDNVLREMHVDNLPPPSLLTDCIKRFKIDRDIQRFIEQIGSDLPEQYLQADPVLQLELLTRHDGWPIDSPLPELKLQTPAFRQQTLDSARKHRLSLFESRYRALEKTDNKAAAQLIDEVRGLPTDIAQELASNATSSELMHLHNGQAPKRLIDAAQKALEAVRAARAHEGLYSGSLETTDTHRLALHTLESLPGWPEGLRIEVRDYSRDGTLRDSIGQDDAPLLRTLVRSDEGTYRVEGSDEPADDFYSAILQVLPDAERNRLNLSAGDGPALRQRITRHTPDPAKQRALFAKNPRRKPFYDPTTMRLPGGTGGYERNFGPTPTLDDRIREVYPGLGQEELSAIAARLQLHPDGPRAELTRLTSEFHQLRQDLDRWASEALTTHPATGLPMDNLQTQAVGQNRRLLAQEILHSWRRQSEQDINAPEGIPRYVLRFGETVPGDLPVLSADFSDVSTLILEGHQQAQGLAGFLQHFTGLRRLELRHFKLDALPDAIGQMPNLDTLILSDCGINFDAAARSKLSQMNKMVMLDLSGNAFDSAPDMGSLSELAHLDLSETGLTEIPANTLQLAKLEILMLMNNDITQLPAEIFDSPVHAKRGIYLTDNPLSDQAMDLIKQQYSESGNDIGVLAPAADIARVRALFPSLETEQASDHVYELPGTLADGRIEIARQEAELAQLIVDLAAWTADVPPLHPLTGEPFTDQQLLIEHANRDAFKELVERCWRFETDVDDFGVGLVPTYELVIQPRINGELPTLNANFKHVSALELESAGGVTRIGNFLEAFPKLQSLRLRECNLGNIPEAVFKMGHLRSLSLFDCRVSLSQESASALAGMEHLDYLDLSSNPLGHTPDLSQMPKLATVLLRDTGITSIPNGLLQINELDWADLSANAITEVPSDITEVSVDVAMNISLRGNPFSEQALQRLIDYYQRNAVDFDVEEVINRGEMEISSAESEVDE